MSESWVETSRHSGTQDHISFLFCGLLCFVTSTLGCSKALRDRSWAPQCKHSAIRALYKCMEMCKMIWVNLHKWLLMGNHKALQSSNSVSLIRKRRVKKTLRKSLFPDTDRVASCVVTNISGSRSHQLLVIHFNSIKLEGLVCCLYGYYFCRCKNDRMILLLSSRSRPDHFNHLQHFPYVNVSVLPPHFDFLLSLFPTQLNWSSLMPWNEPKLQQMDQHWCIISVFCQWQKECMPTWIHSGPQSERVQLAMHWCRQLSGPLLP